MKTTLAFLGAGAVVAAGLALAPAVLPTLAVSSPVDTASLAGASLSATSATTFKNCTALNKKYPHGVGKSGARDKVRGSTAPVTDFYVSTKLYTANKKSDRDKDGVACEKH